MKWIQSQVGHKIEQPCFILSYMVICIAPLTGGYSVRQAREKKSLQTT